MHQALSGGHRLIIGLAIVAFVGTAFGLAFPTARGQDLGPAQGSRAGEIHEACIKQGLAVESVSCNADGCYSVMMRDGASGADRARAEAIRDEILARPRQMVTVESLQDALVVLHFEPGNEAALKLLRARYDELKDATTKKQR